MTISLKMSQGSVGFVNRLEINQKEYDLQNKHSLTSKINNIVRRVMLFILSNKSRQLALSAKFEVLNNIKINSANPIVELSPGVNKPKFSAELIKFQEVKDSASYKFSEATIFELLRNNIDAEVTKELKVEIKPVDNQTKLSQAIPNFLKSKAAKYIIGGTLAVAAISAIAFGALSIFTPAVQLLEIDSTSHAVRTACENSTSAIQKTIYFINRMPPIAVTCFNNYTLEYHLA